MRRRTVGDQLAEARPEKPIGWRGSALDDLRAFPEEARHEAGYQLHLLQQRKTADDWKPMSVVGPGTIEVRIHAGTEHRVFVVTKFEEAVYVLHAFQKKSQKTPKHDIELARRRYNDLIAERRPL
jgi:phage-related protein